MSLTRRFSLQFGMTAGLGTVAAIAASLALFVLRVDDMSAAFTGNLEAAVERQLERESAALAVDLAGRVREALLDYDAEALARAARNSIGGALAASVRVYDNHGRALADQTGPLAPLPDSAPRQLRAAGHDTGVVHWREGGHVLAGQAVCIRQTCLGGVAVAVDRSVVMRESARLEADLDAARASFLTDAVALGLMALAVVSAASAGVGFVMGKRMQHGVNAAIRGIEQIAAGARDVKIESRDGLLRELAEAIEGLAAKLGEDGGLAQRVLDEVRDGLFVAKADGEITMANPALHALLKVPNPTLLGADAFTTFGLTPAASAGAFAAAMSGLEKVNDIEGGEINVLVQARVGGAPPAEEVIAILRDVGDLAAAEAASEQARLRAEAAESARSEFLAVMSHELRTPLNGVLGGAAVLAGTNLDPSQRKLLGVVQNSGRSLLKMIGALLDLSRLYSGQVEADSAPVDLRRLGEAIADSVAEAAEGKRLPVRLKIAAGAPVVLSDYDKLLQIGAALADNAVKFTERGEVEIEIVHSAQDGGAEIALIVRDTGIGIAEDARERIFESFTQGDSSASRAHGGAGLGLALARKLAETLGARIEVESTLGAGSTFTVTLRAPLDPDAAPAAPAPRPAAVMAPVALAGPIPMAPIAPPPPPEEPEAPAFGAPEEELSLADAIARLRARDAEAAAAPAAHSLALSDFGGPAAADPAAPADAPGSGEGAEAAAADADSGRPDADGPAEPARGADVPEAERRGGGQEAERRGGGQEQDEADAEAPDVAPAPAAPPAPPISAPTPVVVLADDNMVNRIVLTTYLRKAGYDCHAVATAAEALERAAELAPSLVLLAADLADGPAEAVAALRRREAEDGAPRVAVLAMAPGGAGEEAERMRAAGADDVLAKPVRLDQLTARLRRGFDAAQAAA